MEAHLNSLQDVVRLTIRQELDWSERRFGRVTMSQDANGKPAELYGADGKIYYRNAGGAGVEIGTVGAGGLYGTLGSDFSLYGSASDDLTFVKFLEWDHDTDRLSTQTETFTLGHDNTSAALSTGFYFYRGTTEDKEASLGWNETADRFEFMEEVGVTLAEVLMRTLKVSEAANVGTITMDVGTGDMTFADMNTTAKTLAELVTGGSAHSALTQLDYASAGHTGFAPTSHTHDDRYYTETEIGTWRNGVTQTEMGYVHGVTSDIQTQLNARMLLSVYDPGSDGVVIPTAGGTGIASYAQGDILYASATNILAKLAKGTATQVLTMNGGATAPEWAAAATGSLWEVSGIYIRPLLGRPVTMEGEEITKLPEIWGPLNSDFSLHGSNAADTSWVEFLKWDHETETIVIGGDLNTGGNDIDMAIGDIINCSNLRSRAAPLGYMGVIAETRLVIGCDTGDIQVYGYPDMNTYKLKNLGAGTVAGDSVRYEQVIGTYLPLAGGTMTGDLDMGGHDITELSQLFGKVESGFTWDLIFYGSNVGGSAAVEMMRWDASAQDILIATGVDLNMNTNKIAGLAAATVNGDAVRYNEFHAHDVWEVSGIYIRPLLGRPVTMEGEEITKLPEIWGPLNSDFSLHGSNAADSSWVEFLKWDHETETIAIAGKHTIFDNPDSGFEGSISLGGHATDRADISYNQGDGLYLHVNQVSKLFLGFTSAEFTVSVSFSNQLLSAFNINYLNFNPIASVAATEGAVYYDSDNNKLKVYNGAAWETITSA